MKDKMYTDEELVFAVKTSKTWKEVYLKIGLADGYTRPVKTTAKKLGLNINHLASHEKSFSDEEVLNSIKESLSLRKAILNLGLPDSSSNYKAFYRIAKNNGVKIFQAEKPFLNIREISDSDIEKAVKESVCLRQVCMKINIDGHGHFHESLRKRINELGISMSHFTDKGLTKKEKEFHLKKFYAKTLIITGVF